mgnify:CR=1 FL=1
MQIFLHFYSKMSNFSLFFPSKSEGFAYKHPHPYKNTSAYSLIKTPLPYSRRRGQRLTYGYNGEKRYESLH